MDSFDWHTTEEQEGGGLVLPHFLAPNLGWPAADAQKCADYQRIRRAALAAAIELQPPVEVAVTAHLMACAMDALRFEEALDLLETCCTRQVPRIGSNLDLQASLLEKRALLCRRWG